jgi:voltage-gated potassium channel
MSRFLIKWARFLVHKHPWLCITILLLLFFFTATVMLFYVERTNDPDLTFFEAIRIVLVFFLGEYGETPSTSIGKIISVVLFIAGIAIVATLIGKIASVFVGLRLEVKMPKGIENHIIMCNWNDRGDRIIKEIHAPMAAPETEIIVITEQSIDENELRISAAYEKVFFIHSDPTMHEVLKKARAHLAQSVIILADTESSDPDAKSALIALAITKLEKELPKKPHIVAEVMNHHKIQHLLDAGVDEWVCATDYGLGIIAQCALYGKLSEVYQQLLTYSRDTNEIYLVDNDHYPETCIGKNFEELTSMINCTRKGRNPTILIGVKRDEQVILNPKKEEFDVLKVDDSLIVLAFDPPDLRES